MKILHICMTQYSDGWTYQENMLSKYHVKLGHEVEVITSMYCYKEGVLVKDSKTDFFDCNNVKVKRLEKKSDGIFKKTPRYKGFFEALSQFKPDIIFSHGCQYLDVENVAKYVKINPKVKVFVDNHADFSNSATNFLSKNILHKIIWKKMAHIIMPYTKLFYGVLPARVDFLKSVYGLPDEKCKLLVMGGDDELIKAASDNQSINAIREKYGVNEDDFLIVTGGKIDEAKTETLLLMEAIKELKIDNVKLLVFGSVIDSLKPKLFSLVDKERIQFVGWLSGDSTYNLFASADLAVFPGRHSVFWEQVAAQGIPMVCKRWKGTQHVDVGGNTIFLDEGSKKELIDTIEQIISDQLLYEKMKKCSIEVAMNVFSYKSIAEKSISV